MLRSTVAITLAALACTTGSLVAQNPFEALPPAPKAPPPATKFFYPTGPSTFVPLPMGPSTFDTARHAIKVTTVVNGLSRPFALAFLPDGAMLITEKTGTLRLVKDGALVPQPISGVPTVAAKLYDGLMDVAVHPDFAQNRLIYLTYTKPGPDRNVAITLARGRREGLALTEVEDLLVTTPWNTPKEIPGLASKIVFGKDGMLYMAVGVPVPVALRAQDGGNHQGKVLRLKDDGTVPADNPFVGKAGYKSEIYTMGHRNVLGLAVHPVTGAIFEHENGPQGGDEINLLVAGKNYGWPLVSEGRNYSGKPFKAHVKMPEMEPPQIFWNPAIAISGMAFYTGDAFPKWKNDVFVGALAYAHLERVSFNAKGEHTNREWMLLDLKQRIRDVKMGPDGNLYLLTDAAYGALLRVEPAQ
jgi:glucose/arabinose dehydrogenase